MKAPRIVVCNFCGIANDGPLAEKFISGDSKKDSGVICEYCVAVCVGLIDGWKRRQGSRTLKLVKR